MPIFIYFEDERVRRGILKRISREQARKIAEALVDCEEVVATIVGE